MSLPHATQAQINEMQRVAEKKMQQDGIIIEDVPTQVIEQKHPMLNHHEQPSIENDNEIVEDESQEYEDSEEEVVQEIVQETPQQNNFRRMREELDQAKRERDEAMKFAMSFQQQPKKQEQQNFKSEPSEEDDYSDIGLDDDGLAEGKHLKKVLKEMRELKKEMYAYKAKATNDNVEVRLKNTYPDFDKVINQENLEILTSMNPDLADMISQTPDMYKRAKLAYDMVKQYGIYRETPLYNSEKAIAQKNAAKPRPLTSISPQQGDSPLSKANAFANGPLSDELKAQYRREMIQAMKGR